MEHRTGSHDEWQYGDRTPAELRGTLLALTLEFVVAARELAGVHRIALLGSLATNKDRPKDADVLVSIDAEAPLEELARIGRQLQGRAQSINSTADVFLADRDGRYLGRVCHYRECHPRVACRARHCGARSHVTDDLDVASLDDALIMRPPLVLYPSVVTTGEVPADVAALLLARLPTIAAKEASREGLGGQLAYRIQEQDEPRGRSENDVHHACALTRRGRVKLAPPPHPAKPVG